MKITHLNKYDMGHTKNKVIHFKNTILSVIIKMKWLSKITVY